MNLLSLKYFVAVAESGNISKVARDLFVSQPAISKMLHMLEEEVGTVLFDHRKGKIELNTTGKRFYNHARKILDEMEEGMDELRRTAGATSTQIRVGSSIYDFFSEVSASYLEQHVDVLLKQNYYDHQALSEKLANNELHFAVSSAPMEAEGLHWEPLLRCALVMHIPQGHPAARKPAAKLSDFKNDTFVVNSMGMDAATTNALCQEAGFVPAILMDTNEALSAGSVMQKFSCVSICSADSICSNHPLYGLINVDYFQHDWSKAPRSSVLLEDVDREHCLGLTRRRRELKPECELFYQYVKEYLTKKNMQVQTFVKHYYNQ